MATPNTLSEAIAERNELARALLDIASLRHSKSTTAEQLAKIALEALASQVITDAIIERDARIETLIITFVPQWAIDRARQADDPDMQIRLSRVLSAGEIVALIDAPRPADRQRRS